MKFPPLALSFLSLAWLTGCVSPTVVDYDRSAVAAFKDYHCFIIDSRDNRSQYQDVVLSPIVDRRIEGAIQRTLSDKGFSQDCRKPDFRVSFNTLTKTKTELRDLSLGAAPFRRHSYRYGYSGFSTLDFDQYEEGTFIIDIIDAQSNELVWRGAYSKRLGWSAPDETQVQQIVGDILSKFPPNPSAPE